MQFHRHAFISYAHIDNQPISAEQEGWISRFHAALQAMLAMRLGSPVDIWRDDRLRGNELFAREIESQFPDTALLISVVSPRYVQSEWCTREVRAFSATAERSGGLVVGNRTRILKVIKTPVDDDAALPEVMRGTLGYPFFVLNEDRAPIELDPIFGAELGTAFARKVASLAWDITQLMHALAAQETDAAAAAGPTVYLAECSYDVRPVREALELELKLHGVEVLPRRELPREEMSYIAEVDRLLAASGLSIHIVGEGYGSVPDGPSVKSAPMLQNERAIARARDAGLRRIIWLPDKLNSTQPAQQAFVDQLTREAEAQLGADLVRGSKGTLTAAVKEALARLAAPTAPTAPATARPDERPLVYVVCTREDRSSAVPVMKALNAHGLGARLPAFSGDSASVRAAHDETLSACHGVLLFWGAGDEAWKVNQEIALQKVRTLRAIPPAASRVYLGMPRTADKQILIDVEEPDVIDGMDALNEAGLGRFMQALGGKS